MHDIVRAQGAHNVQWCWAFNNGASPAADWNDEALAYPGGAYVDWIGIDGYNWGFGPSWDPTVDHWTSFVDTFAAAYARARAIDPGKPVMLPEFASSEDGGSKSEWVAAMIAALNAGRFPNLRLLTWFDIDKEERWSLTPGLPGLRELVGSATADDGRTRPVVRRPRCREPSGHCPSSPFSPVVAATRPGPAGADRLAAVR
ncbi:hypothetical protein [Kutzneria kofuensis]|uniref:hypothetical protein n=1 Tax=Kutzneria kofuensis TaxID=103725 RepID=UPI0031EFC57A